MSRSKIFVETPSHLDLRRHVDYLSTNVELHVCILCFCIEEGKTVYICPCPRQNGTQEGWEFRWMDVNGQHHAPASLRRKRTFASRLGIPQSRSGRFGEDKNVFPLPEIEPQIDQHLASSLAHVIQELKEK